MSSLAANCRDSLLRLCWQSRVLIASYETFRAHAHRVASVPIDLVICDEAHRLKNDKTKTSVAISHLPAKRRLLLSGTPIQNDLDEFFALVSLCNPSVVGEGHLSTLQASMETRIYSWGQSPLRSSVFE